MVHPSFDALKPQRIDVRWPANETVHPLERVAYGGLLQRLVSGERVYNVYDLLYRGLREALEEKGYATSDRVSEGRFGAVDFRTPGGEIGEDVPFDAVLYSKVVGWHRRDRSFPNGVTVGLELAIYKVPGAEKLYEIRESVFLRDDQHGSQGSHGRFLESGLRHAAYRTLSGLPDRE
ncbi:MAG: hypothetical protein O7J95_15380 [Planctomycetota bacterium]|nr:hypothetical protein [Planctomycetota bacterium]